jgi:hypothetical protein
MGLVAIDPIILTNQMSATLEEIFCHLDLVNRQLERGNFFDFLLEVLNYQNFKNFSNIFQNWENIFSKNVEMGVLISTIETLLMESTSYVAISYYLLFMLCK